MKKAFHTQSIILLFATFIAIAITIFVGSFSNNTFAFYWNTFLINLTFIGDAFFAIGLSLFLLFYFNKKKLAMQLITVILTVLFFVQFIKNIFSGLPLQLFFESGIKIQEVDSFFYRNFISSHTALAFTLAVFFAKKFKKIAITIILFAIATLVAYTRIKLADESYLAIGFGLLPAIFSILLINKLNIKKESNRGYFYKSNRAVNVNKKQLLGA